MVKNFERNLRLTFTLLWSPYPVLQKLTIRDFVLHKVFRIRSYSCSIGIAPSKESKLV
jgi:hypothetical protein